MKKLFTLFATALMAGSMMAANVFEYDGRTNTTVTTGTLVAGADQTSCGIITSGVQKYNADATTPSSVITYGNGWGSSNNYYVVIKPAEGKFLAGDTIKVQGYTNNSGAGKTAALLVSTSAGHSVWTSGDFTDGLTVSGDPAVLSYVLEADADSLILSRASGSGSATRANVLTLVVARPEAATLPAGPTISIDDEEQSFSILTANESDIFFFNGGPVATLSEETALEGFADQISFVDADYTLAELVDDGSAYEGSLEDIPFEMLFDEPGEYALAAMCVVENDPVAHTVVAASQMSYTTFTIVAAASGCDWENIAFIGDGAQGGALSNKYKFCTEAENVAIVNIQHPGFATADGLYISLPDAAFGEIRIKGAKAAYDVQGAGILVHLSNFTDVETEVEIMNMDNTDVRWTFNIYYADGANTPTDIENLEGVKVVKYLENGMVVIIREGVCYNAAGQVVK